MMPQKPGQCWVLNRTHISQCPVCETTPRSQKDLRAVLVALVSDSPPTCRLSGGGNTSSLLEQFEDQLVWKFGQNKACILQTNSVNRFYDICRTWSLSHSWEASTSAFQNFVRSSRHPLVPPYSVGRISVTLTELKLKFKTLISEELKLWFCTRNDWIE